MKIDEIIELAQEISGTKSARVLGKDELTCARYMA